MRCILRESNQAELEAVLNLCTEVCIEYLSKNAFSSIVAFFVVRRGQYDLNVTLNLHCAATLQSQFLTVSTFIRYINLTGLHVLAYQGWKRVKVKTLFGPNSTRVFRSMIHIVIQVLNVLVIYPLSFEARRIRNRSRSTQSTRSPSLPPQAFGI